MGIFCHRLARDHHGDSDLEIRSRAKANRKKRPATRTHNSSRLFFDLAFSQRLALLHWRRRFYLLAVSAKCICSALHYRSRRTDPERRRASCLAPPGCSFFIGLVFPGLSDRWGRKPTLLFLAFLSTLLPIALYLPFLYAHLWLLAAILFLTQGGQAIAALIMVLVPAESVPPQFSATAIGLATLVGEIIGATIAPAAGGAIALRFGLGMPLLMGAASTVVLFLAALFITGAWELADAASPWIDSCAGAVIHRTTCEARNGRGIAHAEINLPIHLP